MNGEVFPADVNQDSWVYLVKLHLQDATGEIDAALFDKDANEFFQVKCFSSAVSMQPSFVQTKYYGKCFADLLVASAWSGLWHRVVAGT